MRVGYREPWLRTLVHGEARLGVVSGTLATLLVIISQLPDLHALAGMPAVEIVVLASGIAVLIRYEEVQLQVTAYDQHGTLLDASTDPARRAACVNLLLESLVVHGVAVTNLATA